MISILVTGASGQLAGCLKKILSNKNFDVSYFSKNELDITNLDSWESEFSKKQYNFIINTAAYTKVDLAEEERELCHKINAEALTIIGTIAEKYSSKVIHISTDYVFNGKNHQPYVENHPTDPVNYYGESKLEGENNLFKSCSKSIVIRTSWVHAIDGNNFLNTMIRLGNEREQLSIISDQIGTPTNALHLAESIVSIIEQTVEDVSIWESGVYHYSNEGVCSWYDFALEIFKKNNISCAVTPIPSSAYPTKAARPHFSVLSKDKIKKQFNLKIPHWSEW